MAPSSIIHRHVTTLSLSWLLLLWMCLGCLSSLAQLTFDDLRRRCDGLNRISVLGGADSSAMMMCSDTVGTLNSLDWCLLSTDAPEQRLSLDGIKYAGSAPDITINHINASDEGLYICHFDIVGSGVGQKDAGCLYVLGRAHFQSCLDQPLSTPCVETIEAPPGSVTFNTRVVYTEGGSLKNNQTTTSLQLYSGSIQDGNNLLYSCRSDDPTCANTPTATVIPGDTGGKYDISIQLQLSETDSGLYTVFVIVSDPVTNSDHILSKTFNTQINPVSSPTSSTITSPETEIPSNISLNECDGGTDDCDVNADCADTDGGFICTCREGYSGNGTSCANPPSDDNTTIIAVAVAVAVSLSIIIVVPLVIIVVFISMKRGGTTFSGGITVQNKLNNHKLSVEKDLNSVQEEDPQKRTSIIEECELSDIEDEQVVKV